MDKIIGQLVSLVVIFALFLGLFFGWCMNLIKLTELDFKEPYKAEILRGVGVFPLSFMGVITGYMTIEDK